MSDVQPANQRASRQFVLDKAARLGYPPCTVRGRRVAGQREWEILAGTGSYFVLGAAERTLDEMRGKRS